MKKDEVWGKIKSDTTQIYGQSIFNVFLITTENIQYNHFFQLNPNELEILNEKAIIDLIDSITLTDSSQRKYLNKIFNFLIKFRKNIPEIIIFYILSYSDTPLKFGKLLGKNLSKLSSYLIYNLIEIYTRRGKDLTDIYKILGDNIKNLNLDDLQDLFFNMSELKDLKTLLNIVGNEKIVELLTGNIANLINQLLERSFNFTLRYRFVPKEKVIKKQQYYRYLLNFLLDKAIEYNLSNSTLKNHRILVITNMDVKMRIKLLKVFKDSINNFDHDFIFSILDSFDYDQNTSGKNIRKRNNYKNTD